MRIKLILFFLVFFIDRISKWIIVNGGSEFEVNKGIALSILNEYPELIIITNLIFLIVLISVIIKGKLDKIDSTILVVVLGAGLSNFLDRFIYGGVIDFIDLGFSTINIADFTITTGIVFIFLKNIFNESKKIYSSKKG